MAFFCVYGFLAIPSYRCRVVDELTLWKWWWVVIDVSERNGHCGCPSQATPLPRHVFGFDDKLEAGSSLTVQVRKRCTDLSWLVEVGRRNEDDSLGEKPLWEWAVGELEWNLGLMIQWMVKANVKYEALIRLLNFTSKEIIATWKCKTNSYYWDLPAHFCFVTKSNA